MYIGPPQAQLRGNRGRHLCAQAQCDGGFSARLREARPPYRQQLCAQMLDEKIFTLKLTSVGLEMRSRILRLFTAPPQCS